MSERVIRHLITERSKDWERLMNKYDPKGEYKERYASLAQGKPPRPEGLPEVKAEVKPTGTP